MSKIIAMAALLSLLPTAAPAAPIMTVPPGHSKSQARAPQSKVPLVLGLRANGGTMTSFNDAVGVDLADADYGKFVDPRVQGADRTRALKFLRLMPKNMRGDFVYIDNSGKILSNRPELGFDVHPMPAGHARALHHDRLVGSTARAVSRARTTMSYPPTGGPGGAYIRTYSQQGINAALAYAQAPCDLSLQSNEGGYMYINAYNPNGADIIDAGLGTNISASTGKGGGSGLGNMVAFTNPGQSGWTNQSQVYPCGTAVGIMYGTLPPSIDNTTSALMTGIPDYDPWQFDLPPATTTWSPASWTFFPTNGQLLQNGTTWNGYASNCSGCSIGRMTTIAQPSLDYDGSCYGYCSSAGADAFWLQSVAGQLVPTCQNNGSSATCTIAWVSNWTGGENDSGSGIAYGAKTDQFVATGINLIPNYSDTAQSTQSLPGSQPPAPSSACTPDSQNLCSMEVSNQQNGSCAITIGYKTTWHYGYTTTYWIFQGASPSEQIATVTSTTTAGYDDNGNCTISMKTWSPWEPRVHYNDTNLP